LGVRIYLEVVFYCCKNSGNDFDVGICEDRFWIKFQGDLNIINKI
jgi:hypothetical protein